MMFKTRFHFFCNYIYVLLTIFDHYYKTVAATFSYGMSFSYLDTLDSDFNASFNK